MNTKVADLSVHVMRPFGYTQSDALCGHWFKIDPLVQIDLKAAIRVDV